MVTYDVRVVEPNICRDEMFWDSVADVKSAEGSSLSPEAFANWAASTSS